VEGAAGLAGRAPGRVDLEVSPKAARAIRRALDYLVGQQEKEGAWSLNGSHRAAGTGLAGLALLSAGHVPGRGKHCASVERAARFLIAGQDREGCFASSGGRSMHGHGYALHFMAELYGMTSDPQLSRELRLSCERGVRLTAGSQTTSGGWNYQPDTRNHDEGSITVTQLQALWAARQAGVNVPQKTIDKAVGYIRKSQEPDGGICYSLSSWGRRGSQPALSVAGVTVFSCLGLRETREGQRAIGYMRRLLAGENWRRRGISARFPHYTDLYLGQALLQAGEPMWSEHYPRLRDGVIACQQQDGSIVREKSAYAGVFSTACGALVLTVPYQYLPSFQR
jgi:hypothetical protein